MHIYSFNKENYRWFIEFPEYIQRGGNKEDLEMIDGADRLLDMLSSETQTVRLKFDNIYFDGADCLRLVEICDPYIGGGYYIIEELEGKAVQKKIWLCTVTEVVFGFLPERIFIKKIKTIESDASDNVTN